MIWKILGIEQTKDEEQIKAAYRSRLRSVNPEDDAEGFKELRKAYEEALEYANQDDSTHDIEEITDEKKNDVDRWIDRVDVVYQDARTRGDERKWEQLLRDPVCDDLDTEIEAGEKLLVYFMSHSYMPQAIWKLVDRRFGYMDSREQLKERFPENFLDYIHWQIESPGFVDFSMFGGKTDSQVDEYINKLYEIKGVSEKKDLNKLRQLLNELARFDVTHPFGQVEEARYRMLKQEAEGGSYVQEALRIMEELDLEYSDNPYIERTYAEVLVQNGQIEKAKAVYEALLEENPDNYSALLGRANCVFVLGDAEEAKEQIEDVLEERVQDNESLELLDKVNVKLVEQYQAALAQGLDREVCFKLGWCYYQQKKFDEGIALLDQLGEGGDYDYINLRCRLYLASEDYDKAYPLAEKWIAMIESIEEDGSKELQKRKNRLSLAHFSVGVCIWEIELKKDAKDRKQDDLEKAVDYIKRSVQEEKNTLVRLSYMEQLARFYIENREYEACIAICNEIIEADNGFFPAYVHRQKANYELRNAKEVIDDYFTCTEIYAGYAPPYILAAEVFFAFDQYEDVESVLQAAEEAELESDSMELFRIKCIHYKDFSEENVKTALTAIEKLRQKVKEHPDDSDLENPAELEKEYAILYWDMDRTDQVFQIIDGYLEEGLEGAEVLLHLKVDVLNREKQYEKALKVCSELIRLEPDSLYTKSKLGGCYERLERIEEAIQCYEEILRQNPNYVPALRRMMYIYSFLSNKEDDLEKCRKGVQYATRLIEATGSAEGYVERGNLNIDLYELEQAVEDCKKAIELDPEAYYAYNNLGCALLKLRRVEEALEPLKQVIRMEPDKDHLPYLNLAECYELLGEYEKAMDAYKQVLRLRPKMIHIKKEIARLHVKNKEYDKAIAIYQKQLSELRSKISEMSFSDKMEFYTGRQWTEEKEKLLNLFWEIGDIYRQAGDLNNAGLYYKKAETGPVPFFRFCSCSVTEKLAEYYRDQGDLRNAERLIHKAMGVKDDKQMGSRQYAHLFFSYATILFELGQQAKAENYALRFIDDLLDRKGGEEKLLEDRRYRNIYLYDLAIMNLCAGKLFAARYYLGKMKECNVCVICETFECFEYYFGMGLAAEVSGDTQEAVEMYKKAIALKGDYPCARRHLEKVSAHL